MAAPLAVPPRLRVGLVRRGNRKKSSEFWRQGLDDARSMYILKFSYRRSCARSGRRLIRGQRRSFSIRLSEHQPDAPARVNSHAHASGWCWTLLKNPPGVEREGGSFNTDLCFLPEGGVETGGKSFNRQPKDRVYERERNKSCIKDA